MEISTSGSLSLRVNLRAKPPPRAHRGAFTIVSYDKVVVGFSPEAVRNREPVELDI